MPYLESYLKAFLFCQLATQPISELDLLESMALSQSKLLLR